MFLPIGDSPNPPGTPWVPYGLMGINILVTRDEMQRSGSGGRIDRLCRILLPAIYFAGLAGAYALR